VQTEEASRTTPRRRSTWLIGGGLIVLGLGTLSAWAVLSPGALSYYKTPSELSTQAHDRNLRVGGRVADLERDGSLVTFRLSDGHEAVRVVYRGDVPDTLKNSTDAIAEGSLRSDGSLHATRVQAKCSSKFVSEEDKPEHLGRS
jgi:cytochrome c-type biogenesis protein CcmE